MVIYVKTSILGVVGSSSTATSGVGVAAAMPPKGSRKKFAWPYVPNPPLNPNPLVEPPSPVGRRRHPRKVAPPAPDRAPAPDDCDMEERGMTQAITAAIPVEPQPEPAADVEVVVASDSSDDEQDPVKKKLRAKKKKKESNSIRSTFISASLLLKYSSNGLTRPRQGTRTREQKDVKFWILLFPHQLIG